MTVTDSRNRRWYQFSLRMLLAIVTVSALGMAWWRHRSDCLARARFHAERNVALAREILGVDVAEQLYGVTYINAFINYGGGYTYSVMPRQTISGYEMVVLTVDSGTLPDKEKRLQAELAREAELSDQYYHAIWRPWERLWIDEAR
jgi:hypothetical protein